MEPRQAAPTRMMANRVRLIRVPSCGAMYGETNRRREVLPVPQGLAWRFAEHPAVILRQPPGMKESPAHRDVHDALAGCGGAQVAPYGVEAQGLEVRLGGGAEMHAEGEVQGALARSHWPGRDREW